MILLSRIVAWSLRNRRVVAHRDAAARRSSACAPPSSAHRRCPRRHERAGAGHHLRARAVARRDRAIRDGPVERAMSGIPKVDEVRSISKYGLSVVTVVFEDGTDIYFARQMVCERMREAEEAVPPHYGRPEMGPIATGLGEIYQFVVRGRGALAHGAGGDARLVHRPAAAHGARHRRGQQLRRRGQAVPGGDRSEAAPGRGAVGRGGDPRARANQRERRRRLHRAQPRALRHRHGRAGRPASTICSRSSWAPRRRASRSPSRTSATSASGPACAAAPRRMDGKGEVVVGVALMLMGENSRAVTERVKAQLEELRPTLPAGHPRRALLRPLRAGQPHHQDGRRRT